jgi:hypothetical protein
MDRLLLLQDGTGKLLARQAAAPAAAGAKRLAGVTPLAGSATG